MLNGFGHLGLLRPGRVSADYEVRRLKRVWPTACECAYVAVEQQNVGSVGASMGGTLMTRVFITGSADGLGRAAARTLLDGGHQAVVHVRNTRRLAAVHELVQQWGAEVVVGDLGDLDETRDLADQVNRLGRMDAVIHNAGVYSGPQVLPVNVVAPFVLTALLDRPQRLVYLSSGMHRSGRTRLASADWSGHRTTDSYSDSKLFVTTLAAAVARIWPDVLSNAVDPGWVPTKMGGPGAPDDLRLGHLTQEWLATSEDPEARTTGGYWHHQRRSDPHPAVRDQQFQDQLLDALARFTGTPLI
jgi:NAD(P)-dependent dehydrogenase (short-subunit alcohol dehydrogenase family)